MTETAEKKTMASPKTSRVPAPGDRVILDGRTAQPAGAVVTRTYRPGDPNTHLDAVPYGQDGLPQAPAVYVARADAEDGDGWRWPDEIAPPPPSLEQQFQALRTAGRPVPQIGDEVIWIDDADREPTGSGRMVVPLPRRAKVLAVRLPDAGTRDVMLDVQVWPSLDRPEDPREAAAERPMDTLSTIYRGTTPGSWCLREDLGQVDLTPRPVPPSSVPCDRCGQPAAVLDRVMVRLDGDQLGSLCPTCISAFRDWMVEPAHTTTGA